MTAWWTRTTSVRKVRVRSSAKLRTLIFEAVPTSADATVLEMDVTLVPTFRSSYTISAITFYELRKAMGASEFMILVPLFDLKSLGSFRRLRCRDFKSAALAPSGDRPDVAAWNLIQQDRILALHAVLPGARFVRAAAGLRWDRSPAALKSASNV